MRSSGDLAASNGEAGSAAVDIEAGLKDGTLTAEQAVALAEKRMEAKAAQVIGGTRWILKPSWSRVPHHKHTKRIE